MNAYRAGIFSVSLMLAIVVLLSACQPAAPVVTQPVAQPGANVEAVETVQTPEAAPTAAQPTSEVNDSEMPVSGMKAPQGWLFFDGSTLGYFLAYPPEWEICQKTQYSRLFCEIQKVPEGMGPPPRLYVSVYPKDYTNPDWEVYNFTATEKVRGYLDIAVGESKVKEPGSPVPEYNTYTRLPDQKIAGQTALVIENSKVWEMPAGTKNRDVFIMTEGATYNIGAYYETPEQLALFEQVLESFQFAQ